MKEFVGEKYKIELDESWDHAKGEDREVNRRWFERILCKGKAIIYLERDNPPRFVLHTTRAKNAALIFKELMNGGCYRLEILDGEALLHFTLEALPKVCKLSGARRRRKLPEASKEAFRAGRKIGMKALVERRKREEI